MNKILNSLNTITSDFLLLSKTKNKKLENKQSFENLFYHLRPGTYDITVKRAIPSIKKEKLIIYIQYCHLKIHPKIYYHL